HHRPRCAGPLHPRYMNVHSASQLLDQASETILDPVLVRRHASNDSILAASFALARPHTDGANCPYTAVRLTGSADARHPYAAARRTARRGSPGRSTGRAGGG